MSPEEVHAFLVTTAGEAAVAFLRTENEAALCACGLSANKMKALVGIGRAAAEGRLDAALVRAMNHPTRSAHLTARSWRCTCGGCSTACPDRPHSPTSLDRINPLCSTTVVGELADKYGLRRMRYPRHRKGILITAA